MENLIRKTKIACTLGKSSSSKEVLTELLRAGMDIARISDRFLTIDKQEVLSNLREAMEETGIQVGIMVGLRESDLRLGNPDSSDPLVLQKDDIVYITTTSVQGIDGPVIQCNNMEFPNLVNPGDSLLIDFGKIIFTVIEIKNLEKTNDRGSSSEELGVPLVKSMHEIINKPIVTHHRSDSLNHRPKRSKPKTKGHKRIVLCKVEHNCVFSSINPVHIRPINRRTPVSYANDIEDIKDGNWASENDLDFLVYKQVRDKNDIDDIMILNLPNVKRFIGIQNKDSADIKEDLIEAFDGIVIGRGMLALETSLAEVCRIQKEIIKLCNELGKPVIISTQLLESMIHDRYPSSSEVTDITNAVLDGCDCLLLTGETAFGDNPVAALQACSEICLEAEKYLDYTGQCELIFNKLLNNISVTENVCYCAVRAIQALNGKLIVCVTKSGYTAELISRFMPRCTILALTNSMKTLHMLKIVRGVYPAIVTEYGGLLVTQATEIIKSTGLAKIGDIVAYVGAFEDEFLEGSTSALRIITIT